jgi:hypothetical protein
MGLIPKHSIGDFVIAYIHNPSLGRDVEHLFKIERRELMWEGLFKFEWLYRGQYYSVVDANPLQLKYSTTGAVRESDTTPLDARVDMGQWAEKDPELVPCPSNSTE